MQLIEVLDMGEVEVLLTQWAAVTSVNALVLDAEKKIVAGDGARPGYMYEIMVDREVLGYVAEGFAADTETDEEQEYTEEAEEEIAVSGNDAVVSALAKIVNKMAEVGVQRAKQLERNSSVHTNVHKTTEYIQKINDITKQLDKIEKNQKILSLNASIEAARAGEAGKGFAIVATNVANLATDFGNNNREIKLELQKLNEVMETIAQE